MEDMAQQLQTITNYSRMILVQKLADIQQQIRALQVVLNDRNKQVTNKDLEGILLTLSETLDEALNQQ